MRAGAVLSLLVCLMAVVRGAEVFSNPQFDGCLTDNSVAPWINGIGSIAHSSYPDLFTSIPPGDNCFVNLYSNPAYDTITQTITVPTTGTYDFSALYCCKGDPSVSCGLTLTINGQNYPLSGASITGSLPCTYAPATASGISLTAGSYAAVIKSTYSATNTVEVFVTSASLKPPGGASGDPHMFGFQGQRFDFIGEPGQVINLVTDPELQVNAFLDLMKAGDFTFIEGPVMMQMAFMTRAHTVIVNAGGYQKDQIGFVSVDDVLLPLGQSFLDGILSVTFTVLDTNSRHLGLTGNDHIVAQVDVKLEEMYEFRVFMIENGRDPENPDHWITQYPRRFLDFNASLLDLDRRPHGVLGQTAAPLGKERSVGEWTIEGKDEDYVVKDGLTGTQFSFNLFI